MYLRECPFCHTHFNPAGRYCPQCGRPSARKSNAQGRPRLLRLLVLAIVGYVLVNNYRTGRFPFDSPQLVRDNSRLFTRNARSKAESALERFRGTGREVVIETFAKLPVERALGDRTEIHGRIDSNALSNWASNRMREQNIHGLYIVVTSEPFCVESARDGNSSFSTEDARLMCQLFRSAGENGNLDDALEAVTHWIRVMPTR